MNTLFDIDILVHNPVGSEGQFVNHEIDIWGEAYIMDLVDKGFVPTLLWENDTPRWTWRFNVNRLK